MIITFVHLIVFLLVIALLLWVVQQFIPIDPFIMKLIYVVLAVGIVLWLLSIFGLLAAL